MKKRVMILFLMAILFVAGCTKAGSTETDSTKQQSEENLNAEISTKSIVDYEYGYGVEGLTDDKKLEYNGSPVNLQCFIDNHGAAFEAGILIFVDGVAQEYYDSVNNVNGYNHVFNVREKVKETYDISFIPQKGKAGDTLNVRFIYVLNPKTLPTSENFDFEHSTKITKIKPIELKILKNVETEKISDMQYVAAVDMTAEQYDERMRDSSGRYRNKLRDINFELIDVNNSNGKLSEEDKKLHFFIEGYGGASEEYVLTAFINGICVDYKDFGAVCQIKEGKFLTRKEFVLDLNLLDSQKYNLSKYNSLSIIAVPVSGNSMGVPCKMRTRVFMYSN